MCTSFAAVPQTAKVMALGGKCLLKIETYRQGIRAQSNLGLRSSRGVLGYIPSGKGDACMYLIVSGPPPSSPVFSSTLLHSTWLPS